MSNPPPRPADNTTYINILLVDDIPETRENIKKLLAFETDFKVIGSAGTGREGVDLAKQLKPDIVIMDINMPDMDGIQATRLITEAVPATAVIMMSVQNDTDYLRKAMLAGARNFLAKPIDMDELYNTIRSVYKGHEQMRRSIQQMQQMPMQAMQTQRDSGGGDRAGHVVVIYSPQGGVGKTTIATNLASGLMKEGIKVLLVDADLQFGDCGVFLSLQAQSTLVDLVGNVDDLDTELFDNIVTTHGSGLKVLLGPARPEFADEVRQHQNAVARIIEKIAGNYDFVVVDTSTSMDEMLLGLLDIATKIMLVSTTSLPSVKNTRFVLDLFDQLGYPPEKSMLVLNKVWEESQRKNATLAPERIEAYLKRPIEMRLPFVDERTILTAIVKGTPVIASDRDTNKPMIKELLQLADKVSAMLMPQEEEEQQPAKAPAKNSGFQFPIGKKK